MSRTSVTRLGELLHFGQLFKASGNNYFAQFAYILGNFLVKVSKSLIFLVKSFLGNFYRHLATFYKSHWHCSGTIPFAIPLLRSAIVLCRTRKSMRVDNNNDHKPVLQSAK